ncbi:hypothetical protein Bca52824_036115 [Brassica carinata]|uniref:Uncharacterized protein n=1 Tax=Brassica carinata TaxID=52824 RepID=A0A8X7S5F3_BRACI|nr:hypothetical protein Bca52824_036115 [Brassica carinata]
MVLKPCCPERDLSNLEEASMETSSVILKPCAGIADDSRQRKRKAELDPEEESDGEIEEDKIEEREDDDDTDLLEVPEWDVDSFDGVVYTSSSEPDLSPRYQPFENMEKAINDYRISKNQLITSKGFMVDPSLRPHYLYKRIYPLNFNDSGFNRDYCEEMGSNVEFVGVVRANYRGGPRPKSYITFMAREKPDGPLVVYQAKGMATLDRKTHPILYRPAPTPKPQNQNF